MALTAKRRGELADQLDVAATWINHQGRAGKIRAVAAELRGEELSDDGADKAAAERLAAAEEQEKEAAAAEIEKAAALKAAEVDKATKAAKNAG